MGIIVVMNSSADQSTICKRNPNQESDIARLGRYRNFLKQQAGNIAPKFNGRIESSDIVQQTLLEAHQKLEQFRGTTEAEMAKWLSQMLANNFVDAIRSLHRQKRDINREVHVDQFAGRSSIRGVADWLPGQHSSPSLNFHRAEQAMKLTEAISQLPEMQQKVIVLHHLRGMSLADVARQVNRSQSAVAGLLYRGLKALRKLMAN